MGVMDGQPQSVWTVFYDGRCGICQASKAWIGRREVSAALAWVDSSDEANLAGHPMIDPAKARGRMMLLAPDGTLSGGFDAVVALLGLMPGWRAAAPALSRPPLREIGRNVYRWVAANRHRFGPAPRCADGACRIG